MAKSYTISGLEHLIKILNQYPQLISLSSLNGVREVARKAQEAVNRSKCGCSAGPVYATYRNVFEKALDSMQYGDHLIVKNILKIDQLCFYTKDSTGRATLKCI